MQVIVDCYRRRRVLLCFDLASPTEIYTLSLHDALPILFGAMLAAQIGITYFVLLPRYRAGEMTIGDVVLFDSRSEEHTSELQSRRDLVWRLLLEKKNYGSSGYRNSNSDSSWRNKTDPGR